MENALPDDYHLTYEERAELVEMYLMEKCDHPDVDAETERLRAFGSADTPGWASLISGFSVTRERYAGLDRDSEFVRAQAKRDSRSQIPGPIRELIEGKLVRPSSGLGALLHWAKNPSRSWPGCMLHGDAGTGKTVAACLLLTANVEGVAGDVRFVSEHDLVKSIHHKSTRESPETIGRFRNCSMLIVDHCGGAKPWAPSRWQPGVIEFFRERWEYGRRVVITFRGNKLAFQKTYGADSWATVDRFCKLIEFTGRPQPGPPG